MIGTEPDMAGKILIDTSVWVDFFKFGKFKDEIRVLVNDHKAAYCGLIATELLRGARGREETDTLNNLFATLVYINKTPDAFIEAGQLGQKIAKQGFNIAAIDLILAQLCLDNNLSIFTLDKHFAKIAQYSKLKLFEF